MNHRPNVCPYLQCTEALLTNISTPNISTSIEAYQCHATETPFAPSAVQQSSCCFNSALFARCPYYAAIGEAKPMTVMPHQPARHDSLFAQLSRLFSFGKKKRRRVYYI